jgi:hypothetical protein
MESHSFPAGLLAGHESATCSGTLASAAEISGERQFAAIKARFMGGSSPGLPVSPPRRTGSALCAIALVALLGSGCAGHHRMHLGPVLPPDQVAEMEVDAMMLIEHIDGKTTGYVSQSGIDGKLVAFELLAGEHAVETGWQYVDAGDTVTRYTSRTTKKVTFTALAGHKYKLGLIKDSSPEGWTPTITDVTRRK